MVLRKYLVAVGAAALMFGGFAAAVASTTDGSSAPAHASLARSAWVGASGAKVVLPARCSRRAPSRIAASSWSLARGGLAPPDASAIRLCRYSGLNNHPRLTLIRSVVRTAPGLVGELVREFDKLPANEGAVACPFDDGSEIVALLAYPNGHAVTISIGLLGCETVTNGSVYRTAFGFGSPPAFGPKLVAQLKRLTAPVSLVQAVRPPAPRVSTLGATRAATLFSYCWQQARRGGGVTGVCADGAPGSPAHLLRWRAGAPVSIDLRLPAHDVQIEAARIGGFGRPTRDVIHLRPRRVDRAGQRWAIRLPGRAGRDTDLLISALFANGDLGADLGVRRL